MAHCCEENNCAAFNFDDSIPSADILSILSASRRIWWSSWTAVSTPTRLACAHDAERTQRLHELGLRVLRVPDHEMLKDPVAVLATILHELKALRPPP